MKRIVKKMRVLLIIVSIFFLVGCKVTDKDYSGTYKNDESSQLIITKNDNTYKANISIYRLTTLDDCKVDIIEADVLNISCKDDNVGTINFKFDYQTKVLTVVDSTWSLLNNGDSFTFNK